MSTEVKVPTLGESVTEATIAKWFKKVGDAVAADEVLAELETDKVTVEVPAPAGGKLADGNAFAKRAIEQGVAFVPGAPFYCANPDQSTLRLSFATVGEDKIREGIARLAKALG